MGESQVAFTMHALLLAALVALSHRGPLGLSSADDRSQRCCDELDMLKKVFPEDDSFDCLVEECVIRLEEIRTSVTSNDTSCPVSEHVLCEKFADLKLAKTNFVPEADWPTNSHVTVKNILRVIDSHGWHNCVIVYDVKAWSALRLLTSSLSDLNVDFIIYDVVTLNETSQLRNVVEEVFGNLNVTNVIMMSHAVSAYRLFKETEEFDKRLGRTSGLRMFTQWVLTVTSGLKEELIQAADYFDNVVAILENQEVIISNTSGMTDNRLQCVSTDVSTLMYVNDSRDFQSTLVLLDGNLTVNDTFPNTRHTFNTRTLTVGTKVWTPFVNKVNDSSGEMVYTGLCMDLLDELASRLNFTYVIQEPPWREGWGDKNASGQWEGLVGQLVNEDVDLVVAPLSFSVERTLVMEATYPFVTNYVAGVYKKPDPALDKWRIYLRPFRGEVLLCLGITLLLITCLVHVMAWVDPAKEKGKETTDKDKQEKLKAKRKRAEFPGPSPDDGFWYLYGALLSQGGMRLPRSSSGRMLVAAWWLFSIVMGATYSGNLIAFLTVTLETKPFETLSDLLQQDTYIWGTIDKTATHSALMESKNHMLKTIGIKLHEFAASDPDVLSLNENVHFNKIMDGHYVFLTDSVSAEFYRRDHCDLDQVMDYDSIGIPYAVYLPKGSAFTRLFDEYVMKFVEAGLLHKWKRDWFPDGLRCVKSIVSESPKISVLDVQSVLYVGLIGFGLALIALALEFVCHRHPKLRAWTDKMGTSCVNGCEEEKESGEKGGEKDPQQNNNGDGTGERASDEGDESGFHEVIVTDKQEKVSSIGIFDFESVESRNRFLFDTIYSSPEDFGRNGTSVFNQPGWDRRSSKIVRISDEVKIST